LLSSLLVIFVIFSFASATFASDDEVLMELGGRVLDSHHNPVSSAQVKLFNERHELLLSMPVASDGTFSMKHRPCVVCTLQVVPDDKSSLASALIEKIPGDANRRFLVTLQSGFRVKGRVTGGGKGLKGLLVKVVAAGNDQKHVHSGGEARTARDGTFEMTLTPGQKLLTVENERYANFVASYEYKLEVTADQEVTEIQLPPAEK
jgi:hypothetical protein